VVKAAVAWVAAVLFTDSALHSDGHGTSAVLTHWMAAVLWLLLAAAFTWRAFRPVQAVCGRGQKPEDAGRPTAQS
jgi:hypothetical protein